MTGEKKSILTKIIFYMAIAWSVFQIYLAVTGGQNPLFSRPVHVAFAVALVFLTKTSSKTRWLDMVLAAGVIVTAVYMVANEARLTSRMTFVDEVTTADVIMGLLMVVLILEATRRATGWMLTGLAIFFILYTFAGPYMPQVFMHRGISIERFVDLMYLSSTGIFGTPIAASADYIFYFVLFSAFLELSGAGQLFVDLAHRLTRKTVAGPAKAAVVASSFMGMINGSAAANVAAVGVFTIPLMKRTGYPGWFAASVEAVASTGGQIMPPIMGAGAFVMAEMLGIHYAKVALAAAIPASLYYLAVFVMVDFKARREGIGKDKVDLHDMAFGAVIERIHLFIPMIVLVYYILDGYSLMTAAFRAIVVLIVVTFFRKATRLDWNTFLEAMASGAKSAVTVAIPCATAGIVVGAVVYTGLGTLIGDFITRVAGGQLIVALILSMCALIVFGMGMPTTAAYIMGAVLMAPTLIKLGLPPLVAHMFIFYYSCISSITPPVALASYTAAGIANEPVGKVAWQAMLLGAVALVVPYGFIYNYALVLIGTPAQIIFTVVTSILAVLALGAGIIGFLFGKVSMTIRVICAAGGLVVLVGNAPTLYIIGFGLIGVSLVLRYFKGTENTGAAA